MNQGGYTTSCITSSPHGMPLSLDMEFFDSSKAWVLGASDNFGGCGNWDVIFFLFFDNIVDSR